MFHRLDVFIVGVVLVSATVVFAKPAARDGGGALTVTIQPPEAVAAGAQWSVDGGTTWHNSAAMVNGLAVGDATLQFNAVSGWQAPASQVVPISDGRTTVVGAATYFQVRTNQFAVGYTVVPVPLAGTELTDSYRVWDWAPNVVAVYGYDSARQQWLTYAGEIQTFPVTVGRTLMLWTTGEPSASFAGVQAAGVHHDLAVGYNLISVPASRQNLAAASAVLGDIPRAQGIWRWDDAAQAWQGYLAGYGGNDFATHPGDPILVAVDTVGTWPTGTTAGDFIAIDVSAGPDAVNYAVTTLTSVPDPIPDEYRLNKILLRRVNAGSFVMGSGTDEVNYDPVEARHNVTLTQDFYIGVFEITQKQWMQVMGSNPARRQADDHPVEWVTWDEVRGGDWPGETRNAAANSFVGRIVAKTGIRFDLPTEARWEYACRAGTLTPLNNGTSTTADIYKSRNLEQLGRYYYSATYAPATVGSYLPNAWGLYDFHGNIAEYCLDYYTATLSDATNPEGPDTGIHRALRGGSWGEYAPACRAGGRSYSRMDSRSERDGFRLCLAAGEL